MSRGFVGLEGSEIDFCWVSRGLGGSGFGVKSVFAGCLDGLATFWTGLSVPFLWLFLVWRVVWRAVFAGCLVVLAGLASGLV